MAFFFRLEIQIARLATRSKITPTIIPMPIIPAMVIPEGLEELSRAEGVLEVTGVADEVGVEAMAVGDAEELSWVAEDEDIVLDAVTGRSWVYWI